MDIEQFPDGVRGALPSSLFISHGAPTLALDDVPARHFIEGLGARLGRPRAVLVVSPHWESEQLCVTGAPAPATIHDFFGFPAPLYALRYPAPGSPALAGRVVELLGAAGYAASIDPARGLDHGAWIPLMLMYPAADVPVLQLSINPARTPGWYWRLGRALAGLRAEGVLVVGSGSMTHNLGDFRARRGDTDGAVEPYAEAFADWFADALERGDLEALLDYRARAPAARRAHPTDEHLLPLYVALGAAGVSWSAERVHRSFTFGSIAMDAYLFHTDRASARPSTSNEINLGVNHAN